MSVENVSPIFAKELLDLIEDYKEPEPKVDVPLKPRARRTRATKKETTT